MGNSNWRKAVSAGYAAAAGLLAVPLLQAQDKPPCTVGEVTRAGLPAYDARILEYSAARGMYRVLYLAGTYKGDEEWLAAGMLRGCKGTEAAPVAVPFFHGRWEMFTGGGAYSRGAEAPPLRIRDDGSYTWVIDSRTEIDGEWRLAQPGERKYGYDKRGTAILLLKAESGKNWLVTRDLNSSTGRDKILVERVDMGLTYRGYRTR